MCVFPHVPVVVLFNVAGLWSLIMTVIIVMLFKINPTSVIIGCNDPLRELKSVCVVLLKIVNLFSLDAF